MGEGLQGANGCCYPCCSGGVLVVLGHLLQGSNELAQSQGREVPTETAGGRGEVPGGLWRRMWDVMVWG